MTLVKNIGLKNTSLIKNVGLLKQKGLLTAQASYPAVLEDGNTVKWFDYLENVTKDGSDFVSSWDNKTGINGIVAGALLQAVGGRQPLWTVNGILFDGISDVLKTASFTFSQPEMMYVVIKQVTFTIGDYLIDGDSASTGFLTQRTASPILQAYAGSFSGDNGNLAMDAFGIVRLLFNGASSKLQVNNTTAVTGDFGSLDMGGFTLGSRATLANNANIQVKEVILRKVADGTIDETAIYNYLKNKYGL